MSGSKTSVVVGIFAHNEEGSIDQLLADLQAQQLPTSLRARGVVLANACTDRTVALARDAAQRPSSFPISVEDLPRGGKANTWNHFVAAEREGDAEILVFVDADIRLPDRTALAKMVAHLGDPKRKAVVSRPVAKFPQDASGLVTFAFEKTKSQHVNGAICGMLYAARIDALRDILLPNPCLVEDGFLAACLITNLFEREDDFDAILAAPDVAHEYIERGTLEEFFEHSVRLELGTDMNAALFTPLWNAQSREERRILLQQFSRSEGLEEAFASFQVRGDNLDFASRRLIARFARGAWRALTAARPQRLGKELYLAGVRREAQRRFKERAFRW